MLVTPNENVIWVDVDDTLIIHLKDGMSTADAVENHGYIQFFDVHTKEKFYARPSEKHITLLRHYAGRGFHVVVHSGNGYEYAESIIKQLGIQDYVNEVKTKPNRYIDDLPASDWMGGRIYLEQQ